MRKHALLLAGILVGCQVAPAAFALTLPGVVQPGRQRPIYSSPAEGTPLPTRPAETTSPEVKKPEVTGASFILHQVHVTGMTVFAPADFEPAYSDFLNTRIDGRDITKIMHAIQRKYQTAGYLFATVTLPKQPIKHGRLVLEVHEGTMSRVVLSGITKPKAPLKAYAQRLQAQKPVNIRGLERAMLLMNDLPGVQVKGYMAPTPHTDDDNTLTLVGTEKKAGGYLELNNRGSRYLGPWQVAADVWASQLFGRYSRTEAQMNFTPNMNRMRLYNITNTTPVGGNGMVLTGQILHADSAPGYTLSDLDVESINDTVSMGLRYPVLRTRARNLFLSVKAQAINTQTRSLGSKLSADRLRVIRAGGSYDFVDAMRGITLVDVEASAGLHMFGASAQGEGVFSRKNANPQFTKVTAGFSRLQPLGEASSLLVAAQGQYSFRPLPAAEEYGYGGSDFGRAYDSSEITGDNGLAVKAELRTTPDWLYSATSLTNQSYLYSFADSGVVWNINRPGDGSEQTRATGSSVGVGLNLQFLHNTGLSVQVAQPVGRAVNTQQDEHNWPRVFVRLNHTF